MKWFKHDSDANMDSKLQEILLDYGLEGYGLYWYCLEMIVNKIDADNLTFELEHDARIIARNTGSTVKKISEMMLRFVELDLFQNSEGRVTCLKLLQRLDKSMTSNPKFRNMLAKAKESHDPVMIKPDLVMQDKNRLDKNRLDKNRLDKNRIKKTIVSSSLEEVLNGYNTVIDNNQPNWPKCQVLNSKRKSLINNALKLVKPRAEELQEKTEVYLIRLLGAMANDAEFFSGKPTQRNPTGYKCNFETNFKQERLSQAIDSFAG